MAEPLMDIDPAAARQMLLDDAATLIDVREDDEWAAGHAPGASHVPLGQLDPAAYTDGHTLMVICRSGGRSGKGAEKLAAAGLSVHNVAGGMNAWDKAGLPVVRDDDTLGTVI